MPAKEPKCRLELNAGTGLGESLEGLFKFSDLYVAAMVLYCIGLEILG